MVGSINKVILVGNLGANPETRQFPNSNKVCALSLATSQSWKDRETGERKENTQWHSISVWDANIIKFAESYLQKGSKIYVEGKLETNKWQDASGNDQYKTEVAVRPFSGKIESLSSRPSESGFTSVGQNPAPERRSEPNEPPWPEPPF
jgi:single-strand DNA-binding protein